MRTWEVVGKYPIYDGEGTISHTEIAIASTSNGYATFTERVAGNHVTKTNSELIELAREAFYKSEFSNKAISETVVKVEELEELFKSVKKFMKDSEARFLEMEKSQAESSERLTKADEERSTKFKAIEDKFKILNGAVMEMLTDYYSGKEEGGDVDVTVEEEPESSHVDGSDSSTTHENAETE